MKHHDEIKNRLTLTIQSFFPLFVWFIIKYSVNPKKFIIKIEKDILLYKWNVDVYFRLAMRQYFLSGLITVISFVLCLYIVYELVNIREKESGGWDNDGENLKIIRQKNDVGVTFLVTYVFPLFIDDINTIRNFIILVSMIIFLILLLLRTNLYYQNPILIMLGYKIYVVQINNPENRNLLNKEIIAISRENLVEGRVIKKKKLSDNVYLMKLKERQ